MIIQLADRSIRRPIGILEDVLVQVGKLLMPCNFMVMDLEDSLQVPIILGRSFLATAGAVIDVRTGTTSFLLCGEMVDFCFAPRTSLAPAVHPPPAPLVHSFPPTIVFKIKVLDGDERSHMRSIVLSDLPPPTSTSLGVTSACTAEVVYTTPPFHI